MENERVVLAVAKGRIMDDALRALKKSGINVSSVSQKTRELIFDLQNYRILSCKPIDVPKYVEMGTADCGIACGMRAAYGVATALRTAGSLRCTLQVV